MTDRRQIVDAFLAKLEATKERGIIGTRIARPAWVGDDSDVPTFECALCGEESPEKPMCGHCGLRFCGDCIERHRVCAAKGGGDGED